MAHPIFDSCVVCDLVRPELGGKFMLLGFYGVAPNVEIVIQSLNTPIVLSMVAASPPVLDSNIAYEYVVIITRPDGLGILQTPPRRLVPTKDIRIHFPIAFNIAPPILPGRYSVHITVNGELKLDTSFSIRGIHSKTPMVADPELPKGESHDRSSPRIQCPLCGWSPGKENVWSCNCGHTWNTFDTRGVCPACRHQWTETQCQSCGQVSPHSQWYVEPKPN